MDTTKCLDAGSNAAPCQGPDVEKVPFWYWVTFSHIIILLISCYSDTTMSVADRVKGVN